MCKGPLTHSLHCSEFVELTLVYQLYTKGLTTEQISEVIETVYVRLFRKQLINFVLPMSNDRY